MGGMGEKNRLSAVAIGIGAALIVLAAAEGHCASAARFREKSYSRR